MAESLFKILEKEQKSRFLTFLKTKNKVKKTRNIELFKAQEAGNTKNLENEIGPNAFRGLKKRLKDSLIEFLSNELIKNEVTQEIKIIKELVVARKLMDLGCYNDGFKMLLKLKDKANSIDHFSLINEIYHTLIEYSYLDSAPNQDELYNSLIQNNQAQLNQERLNMAFAAVKKHIANAENINKFISDVYKRFGINHNEGFNFKSLYQLCVIANNQGAYSNDYYSVNLFFEEKVKEIIGSSLDSPKYRFYKIDLFLILSNIYLRKRAFGKSLNYLDLANQELLICSSDFRKTRRVQLETIKALCWHYSGDIDDAINILSNHKGSDLQLAHSQLALASFCFQKGELRESKKIITQYHRSDAFYEKRLGRDWVLNKIYIEVILSVELGEIELAESRMNSLIRRYGTFLKTQHQIHVLPFIKLVRYYCRYPEEVTTIKFAQKVEKAIQWKPTNQEDLFFMSIYAWLKSKMQKRNVYDVVLELVNA